MKLIISLSNSVLWWVIPRRRVVVVGGRVGEVGAADISSKKTGHVAVQIRLVHKLFCKFSVLGVFSTSKYRVSEIDN